MNIILFDDLSVRQNLLPLTFTRPVAKIRVGILTIGEKWEKYFGQEVSYLTAPYLQGKFPTKHSSDNLLINGAVCPSPGLVQRLADLKPGESLRAGDTIIGTNQKKAAVPLINENSIEYEGEVVVIDKVWKIFKANRQQIGVDFDLITKGRKSADLNDSHTVVYGKENLFIEEGVSIKASVLNAEDGPIYLGKNSVIHEGALIKGAFALGEGAHVGMGAKVRGDSTIGPFSKIGGEVSNSVIFGYSNKGHDGFIGNTVIGEWCNLGADTNTSNLKNNYANIKIWDYNTNGFADTGQMFCGMIMGDHSKSGINTMFNTGTVVGVGANIFGAGFPHNFVPSFSWGGANGFTTYKMDKALEVAEKVMARRNVVLQENDRELLKTVFEMTTGFRVWKK